MIKTISKHLLFCLLGTSHCLTLGHARAFAQTTDSQELQRQFIDARSCRDQAWLSGSTVNMTCLTLKPWTEEEKRLVDGWLRTIVAQPLGRKVIQRINSRGPIKFFRTTQYGTNRYGAAADSLNSNYLLITDLLFDQRLMRLRPQHQVGGLLHEIAHLFDCLPQHRTNAVACLSARNDFMRAMNLREFDIPTGSGSLSFYRPYNYNHSRHLQLEAEVASLTREERFLRRHQYALSLGLPSFYSFSATDELFADLVSALALDPEHPSYLPPSIIQYSAGW